MNAFHILGGLFAAWALLVSFLGVTREGWPSSKGGERAVMLISLVLFVCAVSSAILTAAAEDEEKHEGGGGEEHGLALPV